MKVETLIIGRLQTLRAHATITKTHKSKKRKWKGVVFNGNLYQLLVAKKPDLRNLLIQIDYKPTGDRNKHRSFIEEADGYIKDNVFYIQGGIRHKARKPEESVFLNVPIQGQSVKNQSLTAGIAVS